MIIWRRPLHTPQNRENCENWQNKMPQTVWLQPDHGAKASVIACMLQPYTRIRNKCPYTCNRDRAEGMVLVGQDFRVARRGIPATDTLIMRHEDSPQKELYYTKRMVHNTEEGPGDKLFYLERTSLDSSIVSAVLPPYEGVERFIGKEDEETPLPTPLSGSHGITVTGDDIATLRCEVISSNKN